MRIVLIVACALLLSSTHADRASRGTEELLSAVAKVCALLKADCPRRVSDRRVLQRNVKAIGELVGVKEVDPNQPGAKGATPTPPFDRSSS
jgi:hypothetical protein